MKTVTYNGNDQYYEWGKNCATLKYNLKQAESVLDHYEHMNHTASDLDRFYEGYHSGPREDDSLMALGGF